MNEPSSSPSFRTIIDQLKILKYFEILVFEKYDTAHHMRTQHLDDSNECYIYTIYYYYYCNNVRGAALCCAAAVVLLVVSW